MFFVIGPEHLPAAGRLQPDRLAKIPIYRTAHTDAVIVPVFAIAAVGADQAARRKQFRRAPRHDDNAGAAVTALADYKKGFAKAVDGLPLIMKSDRHAASSPNHPSAHTRGS